MRRRNDRGDDESADKSHDILLEHIGVCLEEDVGESLIECCAGT
jgi:hypothetical protein